MRVSFSGDLNLYNIESYTLDPFKYIRPEVSKFGCVINLESVLLPETYIGKPIKKKLCLRQDNSAVKYIRQLDPLLVNISNNHINDYGNYGITHTIQRLNHHQIAAFGAGDIDQDHNLFLIEEGNLLFLSYTTRDTDLTGSILFNENESFGPKELSIELFEKQIKPYQKYIKIVLLHWGIEWRHYPLPEQRTVARQLIDCGADLIVGNHAHVIQSHEQYKNKWIFYSLGHFLFPDYTIQFNNSVHRYISREENNISLMPVFQVTNQNIELETIHCFAANEKFELLPKRTINYYNLFLFSNVKLYGIFYKFYYQIFQKYLPYKIKAVFYKIKVLLKK